MIELNDTEFMGRQVFIREDREEGGGGGRQQNQNQGQGQGQMFERPRHFVPQMQQMQQQGMQSQSQYHDQQQQQQHHQHQQQQQQQQQHFQQQQQQQHQQHHQQFENKMITGGSGEGRKIYVGNLSWEVSKLIIGYQYTLFMVLLIIVKRKKER